MSGQFQKVQSLTFVWTVRKSNASVWDVVTVTDGEKRVTDEKWRSPTEDGVDNRQRLAARVIREFITWPTSKHSKS